MSRVHPHGHNTAPPVQPEPDEDDIKEDQTMSPRPVDSDEAGSPSRANSVVEVKRHFDEIMDKNTEYRHLNLLATQRIKHLEAKNAEMEGGHRHAHKHATRARGKQLQKQASKDINKFSEELRKNLSKETETETSLFKGPSLSEIRHSGTSKELFKSLWELLITMLPFRRDLHMIHAHFGSSLASYFVFQRFVFLQYCVVASVMGLFAVYHVSVSVRHQEDTLGGFISGAGYLPQFMIYSTFDSKERFVYAAVVIVTMFATLFFLSLTMVHEHRRAIAAEAIEAEDLAPFSKEILCAWDNSLATKQDIDECRGKHDHACLQLLEDCHETGQKKARSNLGLLAIYLRRTLGTLLYLLLVGASFTAIILLTVSAGAIASRSSRASGLKGVGPFIVPAALNIINSLVPQVLQLISKLEGWDSARTELKFLLVRIYLSSELNTVILTLSFLMLADPYLLAQYPWLRESIQFEPADQFDCRLDQVADGLFTLVGATWVTQLLSFASPCLKRGLYWLLGWPWAREEFKVAEAVVKKLGFLGLVFVSIPFAPLSIVFVPPYLFLSFKAEKFCIKHLYSRPKRPFRGSQAALLYSVFYLLTYLLVGVTVSTYFFTTKTMAKSCDIQDDYVGLCLDEVEDDLCTPDKDSSYHTFWGQDSDYPAIICQSACGPFVHSRSAAGTFKDSLLNYPVLLSIYEALFEHPYVPWVLFFSAVVLLSVRKNIADVAQYSVYSKDKALGAQTAASQEERKRQERVICGLQSNTFEY
ncbi:hypothetical protein B484DRAFT_477389 [Ochromonadaceae sp. CCMP2298]|nr:hypothetical protein B484DRAFT_477389 [Ochromonadaceae sp. CCMP2298]